MLQATMPVFLSFDLSCEATATLQALATSTGVGLDRLLHEQLTQAGYEVHLTARQKSLQVTLTIKALEACMSQLYMARQAILAMCNPHVRPVNLLA